MFQSRIKNNTTLQGRDSTEAFPGNCLHFTCCPLSGHLPTLTLNSSTLIHTTSLQTACAGQHLCLVSKVLAPSGLSGWSCCCIRTWRGSSHSQGHKHIQTQHRPEEGLNLALTLKEQLLSPSITIRLKTLLGCAEDQRDGR